MFALHCVANYRSGFLQSEARAQKPNIRLIKKLRSQKVFQRPRLPSVLVMASGEILRQIGRRELET